MGRLEIKAGNAYAFSKMFKNAQKKGKSDEELDGIVNQWMICRALEKPSVRVGQVSKHMIVQSKYKYPARPKTFKQRTFSLQKQRER